MNINPERRALVLRGLAAGVTVTVAGLLAPRPAVADPAVDPGDPTAKALGYVTQSKKPESKCSNCMQYHGVAGAAAGPCAIFPGKSVTAAGWCLSWVKNPAV